MKDIVDKLQDSLEYEFNLSFRERQQLLERVKSLEEVKETLNNMVRERQIKIDKAIEYIKEKAPQGMCLPDGVYDMRYVIKEDLLNILEGEDK